MKPHVSIKDETLKNPTDMKQKWRLPQMFLSTESDVRKEPDTSAIRDAQYLFHWVSSSFSLFFIFILQ